MPRHPLSLYRFFAPPRRPLVATIGRLSKDPRVEFSAGMVKEVNFISKVGGQGRFQVSWVDKDGANHSNEYDVIISCLGREPHFRAAGNQRPK